MLNFKLITYAANNKKPRTGIVVNNRVVDIVAAVSCRKSANEKKTGLSMVSMLSILERWDVTFPVLKYIANDILEGNIPQEENYSLDKIRLLPPIIYPKALFCVGANYSDHLKEMGGDAIDKGLVKPYIFLKSPAHTVIGPGELIRLPQHSSQIDWEAELAVVIGRYARNVNVKDAFLCVAGYTILNDLSARDLARRPDWPNWGSDLLSAKTFDTAAPFGPWIVPAEQVPHPHNLNIELWVNDRRMQNSNTNEMIFNIPELIAYLSRQVTLQPGDVISTGTPAGVGKPRDVFLKNGDRVKIRIESIGMLENPVVQS